MITLPFRTEAEQIAAVPVLADHLHEGGLIACPTETVYGFGCLVRADPLDRLARIKRRAADKAFLLLVTNAASIDCVEWNPAALALARAFWPGPLTLALRCRAGAVPARVIGSRGTVAIRATSHPGMQRLLGRIGEPLTSTSANAPGGTAARTAAEVLAVLAPLELDDRFVMLDGGELAPSLPSTIIDCSVEPPAVIRAGAIAMAELTEILNGIELESRLRTR